MIYKSYESYKDAAFYHSSFVTLLRVSIVDVVKHYFRSLYWKFSFGTTINVEWPRHPSSDPNDCWREYLETNVGKQNRHWQWRHFPYDGNRIEIKFLRSEDAMMFVLKYGGRR